MPQHVIFYATFHVFFGKLLFVTSMSAPFLTNSIV